MLRKDGEIYMVKMDKSRLPTVYGLDDNAAYVAAATKMYMGWLNEKLQWIGVAKVTGGTPDHPRTTKVRRYNEAEMTAFRQLIEQVEAHPEPSYS